jgi:RNA polymerase sigma factor (sigma-70 family)
MVEGGEQTWSAARSLAHRFLRQFRDPWTTSLRDDLVQEATIAAWRWAPRQRDQARLGAAVRTIARRTRGRFVAHARRRPEQTAGDLAAIVADVREAGEPPAITVAGRRVPLEWARDRIADVLAELGATDRQLLLAFYEGFCCAELAQRSGRSEHCVKSRLHRARRRVQHTFEAIVRAAGDFDDS